MLTDKQTYYLQTMGIEPWVMRHVQSHILITAVVNAAIHDVHQKKLLYAMFRSIGVSENKLDVVDDLDADKLKRHIQKTKPRIIIALGCELEACDNTPMMSMPHLSDLLQNPHDKKEVYRDLALVKAALTYT